MDGASHVEQKQAAHRVPLNASAVTILAALLSTADAEAEYVIGAFHRAKGLGARGKRQQAEAAATFPVDNFRGHDLRRTAASIMASAGITRLTISKILNHVERSVTAVYDRHSNDPEKAAALTWWDAKLEDDPRRQGREGARVREGSLKGQDGKLGCASHGADVTLSATQNVHVNLDPLRGLDAPTVKRWAPIVTNLLLSSERF